MKASARRNAAAAPQDAAVRIEEAAARLLIERGYNGVSYLDIARELGITHSNIHYYFRTKEVLVEAVLARASESTLADMQRIWAEPGATLRQRFAGARDWMKTRYLRFNPRGEGGRPWGLLSRLSMDADALSPAIRATLRATLEKLEAHVAASVAQAVAHGELAADAPQPGITLQIVNVLLCAPQMTRQAAGFGRVELLIEQTCDCIERAYGTNRPGASMRPRARTNATFGDRR